MISSARRGKRGRGSGRRRLQRNGGILHGFDPNQVEPAGNVRYGMFRGPAGWHLGCVRRESVSGIAVEVQTSPTLGPSAEWRVIAINPPATPTGVTEVPVTMDGPTGFFRLRFIEE